MSKEPLRPSPIRLQRLPNRSFRYTSPNSPLLPMHMRVKREGNHEFVFSRGHVEMPSAKTFLTPGIYAAPKHQPAFSLCYPNIASKTQLSGHVLKFPRTRYSLRHRRDAVAIKHNNGRSHNVRVVRLLHHHHIYAVITIPSGSNKLNEIELFCFAHFTPNTSGLLRSRTLPLIPRTYFALQLLNRISTTLLSLSRRQKPPTAL